MLTCEIKINGALIGHLYIVNEIVADAKERTQYRYEYYAPEQDVLRGKIMHRRADGALALVKRVADSCLKANGGRR